MSVAAETRDAVADHPFLLRALRAGIVNYTAAARFLDLEGETDAIATALRRYADELPDHETESRDVRVRMERGFGRIDDARESAMLVVGTTAFGSVGDEQTAIVATGEVDSEALAATLERFTIEGIEPVGAGVAEEALFIIVDRRDGADAVRAVEAALESIPVS